MNNNSFFALISRMKYINRWGLMHNSRFENLSEHSFETAVIANALANIENEKFGGDYDANAVAVHALFHDCAEIITGDLPTPVKHNTKALHCAYGDIEKAAQETLITGLPEELKDTYRGYMEEMPIIKAADKLSAWIKCIEEMKAGNLEFRAAAEQTERALDAFHLAEVEFFKEHFMDSFKLTLDEME